MSALAKVWWKRIKAGTQNYNDCPQKYKADVKELAIEDVENGVITAEEYEELIGEPFPVEEVEE